MLMELLRMLRRWFNRLLLTLTALLIVVAAAGIWIWRDRPALVDIRWAAYPTRANPETAVTVTWLGVTTLLFDDGETQILIDGFFSRPTVLDLALQRPIAPDIATINYAMNQFDMRRLAAIVPVHSHYDHAMDVAAVANRSSASILGSASTAQIARGSTVPEDQIIEVETGTAYAFGDFSVRLIDAPHAPLGWRGSTPLAGTIDEALTVPAPFTAWREGGSYSVVVAHPEGTTLVQASAGYREDALADIDADVVLLGVDGLGMLGRRYAEHYWQELVTKTGAERVVTIHFDDFTQPFGSVRLLPRTLSDFAIVSEWLDEFRSVWDNDTTLHLPSFGEPVTLYSPTPPDV